MITNGLLPAGTVRLFATRARVASVEHAKIPAKVRYVEYNVRKSRQSVAASTLPSSHIRYIHSHLKLYMGPISHQTSAIPDTVEDVIRRSLHLIHPILPHH